VNNKVASDEGEGKGDKPADKSGSGSEDEEEEAAAMEKKFKIRLEKNQNDNVNISKKNLCFVTILPAEKESSVIEHQKLVEYFLEQKDTTWSGQFMKAIMLSPKISEDNIVVDQVSLEDALSHFASITFKVIFATIPPVKMCGGYFAFCVALFWIGVVTMIVGDVAKVLGCVCGIRESVTAITIVAMGTSLPDTLASMQIAKSSKYADEAIGNVTGSNSVNIFLGLGIPWVIAAHYQAARGVKYEAPPGTLGFSVILFISVSLACFIVLIVRRIFIGGELGGPKNSRYASAIFLFFLWIIYLLFSALQAYNVFTVKIGLDGCELESAFAHCK
jgi:Ca2+/Na+ antiporter